MSCLIGQLGHSEDDFDTDSIVVERLWRMEEKHFWHSARNEWIRDALERRRVEPGAKILEVGCGSGAVSSFLQGLGYEVTGVDTAERLVKKAHDRCPLARFVVGPVEQLPDGHQGPYDAIGLFDVLEHLAEPQAILASSLRWAKKDAIVLATVPALRSLHSIIDDLSGHKLRYEPGELTRLFEASGVRNVVEYGIFKTIAPILRIFRRTISSGDLEHMNPERRRELRLANLRVPSPIVNRAMRTLCSFERRWLFPFAENSRGASILAVGSSA